MTKKELKQLFYLEKEIRFLEEQLREIKSKSFVSSSVVGGSSNNGSISDKVGDIAAKIADYQTLICLTVERLYHQRNMTEKYIESLDDSQLRLVLRMRFVKFYGWGKIARAIGSYSEATPRRMVDRFFEQGDE